MSEKRITIIGGGLAGSEAAWQAAALGCHVSLIEMKPKKFSPAHKSEKLAELVCSNSFRSDDPTSAVGLLKREMRTLNSLILEAADFHQVPAGKALAVDRELFAEFISQRLHDHPLIDITSQEITELPTPNKSPTILATGPLTTDNLADSLAKITGQEHLSFYDAIAPIIYRESLDNTIIFQASRYDDGPGDYLNCPMDKEQYLAFISALGTAETVPLQSFEKKKYFEGCLPIEVMLARGEDTLRFGPMKPVGLPDPRTGKDAYAIVQLRMENKEGTTYNMVGFQTKLTYGAQKKVFSLIPGMERVEFARLGSIHRNTFICAPEVLTPTLQLKKRPDIFLAGQLTGVEGYVESTAMGILAGINAAKIILEQPLLIPPNDTGHGALIRHLSNTVSKRFQPSNINFGLFPEIGRKMRKRDRGQFRSEKAALSFTNWLTEFHHTPSIGS